MEQLQVLMPTVGTMLIRAARQAGLMALTCLIMAVLLVVVGKGPFTRWVPPGVLLTVGMFAITAWRERPKRRDPAAPSS